MEVLCLFGRDSKEASNQMSKSMDAKLKKGTMHKVMNIKFRDYSDYLGKTLISFLAKSLRRRSRPLLYPSVQYEATASIYC